MINPSAPINVAFPVDRAHPLNAGRIAWWLVLPYGPFGGTWRDLMGRFPGKLTGMVAADWRGTTQPGGFGSLQFTDIVDCVVATGSQAAFALPGAFTLGFWFRTSASAAGYLLTGSTALNGWRVAIGQILAASRIELANGSGTTRTNSTNISDNLWHRCLIVHPAGGPTTFYIDGRADGSAAQADMTALETDLHIGSYDNSHSAFQGPLNDITAWSRALSAAEVTLDYQLSTQGYPGVLNRWRPPAWSQLDIPPPYFPANVYINHSRLFYQDC